MVKENVIDESIFVREGVVGLPTTLKCYLDYCSEEYNDYTTEEKLHHFGYLVSRGIDLYPAIKEHIDNNDSALGYGTYEGVAKWTMVRYLCMLRTGKVVGMFFQIYCGMTMQQLYKIFVKELKLRYSEYREEASKESYWTLNGQYWNEDDIVIRYKEREEKELRHYLMTDTETKSLIKSRVRNRRTKRIAS